MITQSKITQQLNVLRIDLEILNNIIQKISRILFGDKPAKNHFHVFVRASNKLYEESIVILDSINELYGETIDNEYEIKRLKKIGFQNSISVKKAELNIQKNKNSKLIAEASCYFNTHYPTTKFILFNQIENICKEHGMLCGMIEDFLGDIPANKLNDIEYFKLLDADKTYYSISPNIKFNHHPANSSFKLLTKEFYNEVIKKNPQSNELYKDEFPLMICSDKNMMILRHENISKENANNIIRYNEFGVLDTKINPVPLTVILKPVFKFNVYGFLIITSF